MTGRPIVVASWAAVTAFAGVAALDAARVPGTGGVAVGVGLAWFGVSLPVWLYAFGLAVVRTGRGDDIGVGGLFLLVGSAPRDVRRHLLGALAASIVVAAATAAADPFGVLVPMLPLGLAGLWGARHGAYRARAQPATGKGAPR